MGTNFYATRVPSAQEHEEMEKALANHQYKSLQSMLERCMKIYHIGKRSNGWQFIFESYYSGAPWKDNDLQSIKDFLSDPNIRITDECGTRYNEDQDFWEEVKDCLYRDENHINKFDYDENNPPNLRIGDYEFISPDGLRFSWGEFS